MTEWDRVWETQYDYKYKENEEIIYKKTNMPINDIHRIRILHYPTYDNEIIKYIPSSITKSEIEKFVYRVCEYVEKYGNSDGIEYNS